MDDGKVFSCRLVLRSNIAPSGLHNCDLIFVKGVPFAVLEWLSQAGSNEEPGTVVQLEERFLTKVQAPFDTDYLYQVSVVDPRGLPDE